MKFSSKVLKCGLSPMRKFHPYAVAAEAKGKKIYHLNIGQPDIETPKAYFEAVRHFDLPVLAYAPSPGIPELIAAIQKYYDALGMHFETGDILITNGGSEALQITMNCILDDGDEILIPEPFYPNYNTMAYTCGAKIHPIPTSPHDGYHYADRAKVEAEINEHTRAIMVTNPGNPTGAVLTPEEMRMMVDSPRSTICSSSATRPTASLSMPVSRCNPWGSLPTPPRTSSSSTPSPSAFPPAAPVSAA